MSEHDSVALRIVEQRRERPPYSLAGDRLIDSSSFRISTPFPTEIACCSRPSSADVKVREGMYAGKGVFRVVFGRSVSGAARRLQRPCAAD